MIEEVRQEVIKKGFQKEEDEIYFFKNIKPRFVFRLIYHISIYNLETNRPNSSIKIKRKYL
ncbi:MAG: RteC domain-containing protein [Flavobacteriales bacterium]|nr:RteC domain-containing protein [Flavobacteriales bacterium]